jgi:hypothetical protein
MTRQLLEHSNLLIFPLIALVLFLAVFVAVCVRTFARKAEAYTSEAALPLQHDDEGGN